MLTFVRMELSVHLWNDFRVYHCEHFLSYAEDGNVLVAVKTVDHFCSFSSKHTKSFHTILCMCCKTTAIYLVEF